MRVDTDIKGSDTKLAFYSFPILWLVWLTDMLKWFSNNCNSFIDHFFTNSSLYRSELVNQGFAKRSSWLVWTDLLVCLVDCASFWSSFFGMLSVVFSLFQLQQPLLAWCPTPYINTKLAVHNNYWKNRQNQASHTTMQSAWVVRIEAFSSLSGILCHYYQLGWSICSKMLSNKLCLLYCFKECLPFLSLQRIAGKFWMINFQARNFQLSKVCPILSYHHTQLQRKH